METKNYWLVLFTAATWQEFVAAGAKTAGFREGRRKLVRQIEPGDYLLCYLTGISRFIGILEAISAPYEDHSRIWRDEVFPTRVGVRLIADLTIETAVPVKELTQKLSIFKGHKGPTGWIGYVRRSPMPWDPSDAEAVIEALMEAKRKPIARPVLRSRLTRYPSLP